MTLATLLRGDPGWTLPAVCVAVALVAWAIAVTRRALLPPGIRVAAMSLKALAAVFLSAALVEPLWSSARARPQANDLLIVADASRSLALKEAGASESRGERLRGALAAGVDEDEDGAEWLSRLEETFRVRRFSFDARVRPVADFRSLATEGESSRLMASLRELAERHRGGPVAGIVCLTDGTSDDLAAPLDASGLPPIYPVLVSRDDSARDLAVQRVRASQTLFEHVPVTIEADVGCRGFGGRTIAARLFPHDAPADAAPVAEGVKALGPLEEQVTFRLEVRPGGKGESREKPLPDGRGSSDSGRGSLAGVAFYRVEVSEVPNGGAPPFVELTLDNNRALVCVDRGGGPHRVLYVSGRPNWEFKFLRRAVEEDSQVQLAALIRVAKREAKFDFRGRAGESSNALFRGFKADADAETERFDEPVLVRLNMRDADELRGGFPRKADDLFGFRAVILDDVEATFFTRDQLLLLARFVSERGGGLLMLGGAESFAAGGWGKSSLASALPVWLDRTEETAPVPESRLVLSRDGMLLPWLRLRATEAEEAERLAAMPSFQTINPLGDAKPGAFVAAWTGDAKGNRRPALVAQRYGRGTVATVAVGDLWRWQLRRSDDSDDLARQWRQLVRWLVNDAPSNVEIDVGGGGESPQDRAGSETVRIQIRARDAEFAPLDNADVRLSVVDPDGRSFPLSAEATSERGTFSAELRPRRIGAYRILASVYDPDGREIGLGEAGLVHDPLVEELRHPQPHVRSLERLAKETGGELLRIEGLADFARRLPRMDVPIVEETIEPLWDRWWCFALVLACLTGEWTLRRWKGLP